MFVANRIITAANKGAHPPTPVSGWTFDNVSGNTVYDEYGINPGTKHAGSTFASGRTGNAIDFTALSTDIVDMGHHRTVLDTATNSVSLWLYMKSAPNGALAIMDNHYRSSSSGFSGNNGWVLRSNSTSGLRVLQACLNDFTYTDGGDGTSRTIYVAIVTSPNNFAVGQWHHVVVVSRLNSVSLYVNKNLVGTTSHAQNKLYGSPNGTYYGHYSVGAEKYEGGQFAAPSIKVDSVRHYNVELSSANIEWLYNNT